MSNESKQEKVFDRRCEVSFKIGFPDYSSFEVRVGASGDDWKRVQKECDDQLTEMASHFNKRFSVIKKGMKARG